MGLLDIQHNPEIVFAYLYILNLSLHLRQALCSIHIRYNKSIFSEREHSKGIKNMTGKVWGEYYQTAK